MKMSFKVSPGSEASPSEGVAAGSVEELSRETAGDGDSIGARGVFWSAAGVSGRAEGAPRLHPVRRMTETEIKKNARIDCLRGARLADGIA
jgi:hypothetical protein